MVSSETVSLITGSNGGLGRDIIDNLLRGGMRNIACHYRSDSSHIREILSRHDVDPERHLFQAELTDEADLRRLRSEIESKLGPVRHLVNLAGGSSNGMSWKLSKAEFENVLRTNLLATFLCCREFIPSMRDGQYGRIVNISSVVGFAGIAGASHYAAAKAGIAGFSKSISLELANRGITVNTLALGYHDVGIISHVPEELQNKIRATIPVGRFGRCSEVAGLLAFLLSPESAYITGQTLHVNGGLYS